MLDNTLTLKGITKADISTLQKDLWWKVHNMAPPPSSHFFSFIPIVQAASPFTFLYGLTPSPTNSAQIQ